MQAGEHEAGSVRNYRRLKRKPISPTGTVTQFKLSTASAGKTLTESFIPDALLAVV